MTDIQYAILGLIGVCACLIIIPLIISWGRDWTAAWRAESESKSHFGDPRAWQKRRAKSD